MNSEARDCQNCHGSFVIEPEDFGFYEKIKVPPPTWCPKCRARRRFMWRSENALYWRKSDYSDKLIFSGFSPKSSVKVYENEVWFSDKWDPLEYGQEYDFSRPFLDQFSDLLRKVPLMSLSVLRAVQSDYCNWVTAPKNCYLIFNTTDAENCAYGNAVNKCRDCVDNSHLMKCELCYESFWLTQCSRVLFSSQCEDSTDIYFSKNLYGCNNCFGCVNLRNKSYHIWNQPYSREEYTKKLAEFNLGSSVAVARLRAEAHRFHLGFPNKFMEGTKNVNVSGEYISNSKDIRASYLGKEGENLRYCQYLSSPPSKDCWDQTAFGDNSQLNYECVVCGVGAHNLRFCWWCWPDVRDVQYSVLCGSSADLFGCISLRKKQYCILNRQYTKSEYEALLPKIIAHMDAMPYTDKRGKTYPYGEFFPAELSPFGYNETVAQEHWPLTRQEAEAQGYVWRESKEKNHQITLAPADLPDHFRDIPNEVSNEVIGCAHNGKCNHQCATAFKIIPQELQFYKKMELPLPRLCPNCRRAERLAQRHSLGFFYRQCGCAGLTSLPQADTDYAYKNIALHDHGTSPCPNEFETSYASGRPEIVYCEQCYNREVV